MLDEKDKFETPRQAERRHYRNFKARYKRAWERLQKTNPKLYKIRVERGEKIAAL